jgi:Ca2+-binding RTX toxin-like protein
LERVALNALGGAYAIAIDNPGGGVAQVTLDLGVAGAGDAQPDQITLRGTAADEGVDVSGEGASYVVRGLTPLLTVLHSEGNADSLRLQTLDGRDFIDAQALAAGLVRLVIESGAGEDLILGSVGGDDIQAGDDDDVVVGGPGDDFVSLGEGADTFAWNPGDASDLVNGDQDTDILLLNGSATNENFDVSASGALVRVFRDVSAATLDLDDVEQVRLNLLGGADTVAVNDLATTDLEFAAIDLGATPDGPSDQEVDQVFVSGTSGDDSVSASEAGGVVTVAGLKAVTLIRAADPALDRLTLNTLAGADVIDASAMPTGVIELTQNGGLNADTLLGGAGSESFNGGDGDDVLLMGGGDDTAVWNPGDDSDTIEGQQGTDLVQINGANVGENFSLSANGDRLRLFRDVASVTLDMNDVERVELNTLGGADTVTVFDLTGTDVVEINLRLAAFLGGIAGDAQVDNITIHGTNGDDVIAASGSASGVSVAGLATNLNISGFDSAVDRLTINALGGDDVVEGSTIGFGSIQLTANGGDDDDVLIGGDGNDTLLGGNGDDVLLGGPGVDILDGGPGDNVLIQG